MTCSGESDLRRMAAEPAESALQLELLANRPGLATGIKQAGQQADGSPLLLLNHAEEGTSLTDIHQAFNNM